MSKEIASDSGDNKRLDINLLIRYTYGYNV